MSAYLTVGVLPIVGIALLAGAGALNHLLGPSRVPGSEGFRTYESGVEPVGEGWSQSQIRYYVYAFLRGFRRRSGLRLSVGHDLRRPGVSARRRWACSSASSRWSCSTSGASACSPGPDAPRPLASD